MSRCYPYGPTASDRNGASGESLIGTIKLHCENKKSKTESLIEKNERKEKRKERKEKKEKHYDFCDGKVKKLRNQECYQDEKNRGLLVGCLSKGSEDEEVERLDKSDLTDEHDEPVCYLSDGTQSGNKRKRQPSPPITPSAVQSTTASITIQKNIIRIRLSSQRHSETDASLSKGQSCSTCGRTANSIVQHKEILQAQDQKHCDVANNNNSRIPDSVRKESILQVDCKAVANGNTLYVRKESILQVGGMPVANGNTLYENKVKESIAQVENKVQSTKSFYESLIEDWVPPLFQSELDEVDDEEWLFGTKQQLQVFKRLKGNDFSDVSCGQNSTTRPCAHRLPEADIYALPYTIPY